MMKAALSHVLGHGWLAMLQGATMIALVLLFAWWISRRPLPPKKEKFTQRLSKRRAKPRRRK
jgi:hypothetical protein